MLWNVSDATGCPAQPSPAPVRRACMDGHAYEACSEADAFLLCLTLPHPLNADSSTMCAWISVTYEQHYLVSGPGLTH